MRSVQLTEHFAQHLLEVVIVVDIRQEAFVSLAVALPVNSMNVLVIELVFHLSPNVVEHICALLVWLVVELSLKLYVLHGFALWRHLLDASVGSEIDFLVRLVEHHFSIAHVLYQQLRVSGHQVAVPQVHAFLKRHIVVYVLAILVEQDVAEERRSDGESHDAVTTVFEVEFQRLHFLCLRFLHFLLFLFFLLLLFLLLLFGHVLLCQRTLFLIHAVAFVGFKVEEHEIGIVFSAPAAMAAVAGTVAVEQHRLSVEHPFGIAFVVSALGEVVNLAVAGSIYQSDV